MIILQETLKDLQDLFFNPSNSNQRVALENNVLRQRCQSILEDLFRSQDVTEATMQQIFQVSKKIYLVVLLQVTLILRF